MKRYDMHAGREVVGNREHYIARMIDVPEGRFVEYADVAGLVEALKALLPWAESASYGGPDIEADINKARNELARWQS